MNVYDFDNTIYNGDSTEDFIKWCVKRKPSLALKLIGGGVSFCAYKLKMCSKTHFKEKMFSYLSGIPETDEWVNEFWNEHLVKLPLDPSESVSFGIAVLSSEHMTSAARKFVDYAIEFFKE